jgi:hypothetical protein
MLWHLTRGARLPELCQAAGIKGPGVLGDLLPFVPTLADLATQRMLQGRSM